MADTATPSEQRYREKQRVQAAQDLEGVPEGTKGKVLMVTGLSWIRYRVRFDNGVELTMLDAEQLAPAAGKG